MKTFNSTFSNSEGNEMLEISSLKIRYSGSKTAIAYLFMLLIMRKMQCSKNLQKVKGASLLRKIEISSHFVNVRFDRVAAPYMLNGSYHSAAVKCDDPYTTNEI